MSRVAIIGAGGSGLTAIKACLEEDLKPVCFEKNDYIGGLWQYHENRRPDGRAVVWQGLRINGSRFHHFFSDFDLDELPLYPSHNQVVSYLHSYADKFNLNQYIRLSTEVLSVEPKETGWIVTYKHDQQTTAEFFDLVLVAAGRYGKPLHPELSGLDGFEGVYKHSNEYMHQNGEEVRGKRVLVIGNSLTGGEIAALMAESASEVYLSVGKGMTVIQRPYLNSGKVPFDTAVFDRTVAYSSNPIGEVTDVIMTSAELCLPNQQQYNLRNADTPWFTAGIANSAILGQRIKEGKVHIKRYAVEVVGKEVQFDDGTKKEFDTIYGATGFKISFPFLSKDIIGDTADQLDLFKFTWPVTDATINRRDLAFIGIIYGIISVNPFAELQSRWAVRVHKGLVRLPPNKTMIDSMAMNRKKAIEVIGKDRGSPMEHVVALTDYVADQIGALPRWWQYALTDPYLAYFVRYGNNFPCQYRLVGPHKSHLAKHKLLHSHETLQRLRGVTNWPKILGRLYQIIMASGLIVAGAYIAHRVMYQFQ